MRMTSSSPASSKELLENEVKPLVERFLRERGLQLSPEKTCITHIEQGFDFLGQNLRKYGGKLLITPSKKNMHAFLEKVRGHDSFESRHQAGVSDQTAQPGHPWLGELSPPHRSGFGVSESGNGPLALALAMGKAPASEQVRYLDRRSILAPAWTEFMVLRCAWLARKRNVRARLRFGW